MMIIIDSVIRSLYTCEREAPFILKIPSERVLAAMEAEEQINIIEQGDQQQKNTRCNKQVAITSITLWKIIGKLWGKMKIWQWRDDQIEIGFKKITKFGHVFFIKCRESSFNLIDSVMLSPTI